MNKALHPERLTIQPAPLGYRPPSGQPPPQVIRAPAPQVKRKQSKSSASGGEPRSSGSGTGTTKKKGGSAASPAVDSSDRSAAVKAMMQQAQKQAQQTQLQIQQFHSNVAGEPGSPSTELSGSTSKLQSPTPGLLSTYGGGPAAATLLQQQQQLARKQQQLRMQHQMRLQQQQQFQGTPGGILFPMPDGVAGLKGPSSLTPQQLQMYYAQKAQANGSGNTAKTAAVQNAFPLPMKSASSSIATVGIGLSGGEVGSANGTAATSTGTAGRGTGGRGGTKKDAQQKQ